MANKIVNKQSALSAREIEIIGHIADGSSTKEIAGILSISVDTVEVHRHNILKKTCCKNSAHLVKYSIQNGYIK